MACVLVIEDNPSNFKLFETALRSAGHEAIWAKDGDEGLRIATETPVDLILLDLRLPGMDGFDLAKRLRGDERTARTPVVVVSAQAMEEDMKKAKALGVEGYLTKPIRYKELLKVVEGLLKERKGPSA